MREETNAGIDILGNEQAWKGRSFTIPGVYPVIRVGDEFTIDNMLVRNPDRRWWQFWKPKWVQRLKTFRVIATNHP